MDTTVLIFLLVYLALALGHVPGFKVDRTGATLVGAIAMIGVGSISNAAAWTAIDYQTIGLLFGLMVVSGSFVVSGFYALTARKVASLDVPPPALLGLLIATGGCLSALLTNDVVMVAMTPLLVAITLSRGLNPIPFLLGFCFAANTGSAATLIGSPQNMIAAQALNVSFTDFTKVALVPALLSLPIVWGVVTWLYRGKWHLESKPNVAAAQTTAPSIAVPAIEPFDRLETLKAAVVTAIVIAAFVFSDWPRELIALSAAAVMLVNRRVSSKEVMGTVDGNLLVLLAGLFVVNAALAQTGLPDRLVQDMRTAGLDFTDPSMLFLAVSALSNIVGNNPAVMLLASFLPHTGDVNGLIAALALGTGFSSNMVVFGSLAGIIVVEQAASKGITISIGEFCRAGIPVSIACMAMAFAWIAFLGM